jgi:hypothetical protein
MMTVPSSAPLLAKGDAIELIRASLPEAGKLPQII